MLKIATPAQVDRQPVYFTPDRGICDPRIDADRTGLYHSLRQTLSNRIGYSSTAAGWSEDVVAERWSLPPMEGFQNLTLRHRFVVPVGLLPTYVRWDDDGCAGEGLTGPGLISLMPQGLTSRTCWTSDLNVVSLEFSSSLVNRVLDGQDSYGHSEQLVSCRNVPDAIAHDLARNIVAELAMPTERLYGEMLCLALVVHALRAYGHSSVDAVRFKGRLSPIQARRVLEYIRAHLDGSLSIPALAQESGLSDAHFARAFRATFNEPPHRLVLRWRLERSVRLIGLEGFSLADAAAAAGFCDQAHFANAIRRHFGQSPGKLLRQLPTMS
jgi:AraC-like DNA-binding protein